MCYDEAEALHPKGFLFVSILKLQNLQRKRMVIEWLGNFTSCLPICVYVESSSMAANAPIVLHFSFDLSLESISLLQLRDHRFHVGQPNGSIGLIEPSVDIFRHLSWRHSHIGCRMLHMSPRPLAMDGTSIHEYSRAMHHSDGYYLYQSNFPHMTTTSMIPNSYNNKTRGIGNKRIRQHNTS